MKPTHSVRADYTPVACGFHDRLEHWAVRRARVEVVWRAAGGERSAVTTIDDVLARDGADWAILGTGDAVRADRLLSVDGLTPSACGPGRPTPNS